MSEWPTVSCGQLVESGVLRIEDGNHGEYRPRPTEFVDEGIAYIRAADVGNGTVDFLGAGKINDVAMERIRKGIGQPQDVLLSHKGTVGRVAVAPDDSPAYVCSPQTTFWRTTDRSRLNHRFLAFFMQSPRFVAQLDSRKAESDMAPYVSLTEQKRLRIDLPPIGQQRAIADVLGSLDDKIAANRKMGQTAGDLALLQLRDAAVWASIGELVEHKKLSRSPNAMGAEEVAHYSLPAFDSGQMPEIVDPGTIKSAKFRVENPSVLISKLNPQFPRIWDIPVLGDKPAYASTEFLVLESPFCATSVLATALRHPAVSRQLEGKVAGTSGSHQRVKPADLLATEIVDPRHLGSAVLDVVTGLGNIVFDSRNECRTLAALRDTLLPQLMSGKLRVRDAESVVEEAI